MFGDTQSPPEWLLLYPDWEGRQPPQQGHSAFNLTLQTEIQQRLICDAGSSAWCIQAALPEACI